MTKYTDDEIAVVGHTVIDKIDSIPYDSTPSDREIYLMVGEAAVEVLPDRDSELLQGLRQIIDELALTQDPRVVEHYTDKGETYTPIQVQAALGAIYKDLAKLLPDGPAIEVDTGGPCESTFCSDWTEPGETYCSWHKEDR
jgi:hypothetical protein